MFDFMIITPEIFARSEPQVKEQGERAAGCADAPATEAVWVVTWRAADAGDHGTGPRLEPRVLEIDKEL